ncbi:MAG: hypothetical protein CVT93_06865 [Bacteroidetes bacterium HGW-Bacteroidetes-10]|nr:MAG: hypothetical protein CVT93_06865 [Bacteroidetes bacterium HGW-Bacteroidetes-10]
MFNFVSNKLNMNFKRFLLLLLGFQTVSIACFAYQNERQLNIPYLSSFVQSSQQENATPSSLFSPVQKNINHAIQRSRKLSLGVDERTYIFSYKRNYYVLTKDSVYISADGELWRSEYSGLDFKNMELGFLDDIDKGYLFHESGGMVLQFNGRKFRPLNNSPEFRNQYNSFAFLHDRTIYIFGGYGYFTQKSTITYYDKLKGEWELLMARTPEKYHPRGRYSVVAQKTSNKLYIGQGLSIDDEKEYSQNINVNLKDFWVFDFGSKEWKRLGNGRKSIDVRKYHIIYDFHGKTLLIGNEDAYTMDIATNELVYYPEIRTTITMDTQKSSSKPVNIIYNPSTYSFFALIYKDDGSKSSIVIPAEQLLGKPSATVKLYSPARNPWPAIFIFLASALALSAFFMLRKRKISNTTVNRIQENMTEIESVLTTEEFKILKMILDMHPNRVQFLDLMSVFGNNMSYESLKKKLRFSIQDLEAKLQTYLKTSTDIFVIQRNKDDKRNKEIGINE